MGVPSTSARTFLFTDIEGSTRRWQEQPEAMGRALVDHDDVLRAAIERAGGTVFKHTGDGMCAVFESTAAAVGAAVAAQRAVAAAAWDGLDEPVRVRMGIHAGVAEHREDDWFGPVLNRTARIMGVGHGGQVLVSGVAAGLLADDPCDGVGLVDMGHHRLRDLVGTEHIHQVNADGLDADFPALRTLDAYSHNLPLQRTSFIGREDDLIAAEKRLDVAQLVTLTGIGGAGKTRLALELAARVVHRFRDGVAFVDLGPVGDGDVVPETVAAAAGMVRGGATAGTADAIGDLTSFLARREQLLVVDNCEHLVDDCAELIDELLLRCPDLTVLATSREPLGLDGEHVVRVGSLAADDINDDAVRLFDDRAAAIDPNWDAVANRPVVADICRRLDGLPLAIELAAAQVRYLSPTDIADRLDDRFTLLTGGRRRVQRQQTLEAVLDWSHDLLDDQERTVLRRLSVFAGSFSLEAAEAVADADDVRAGTVRRVLRALVDKSLVLPMVTDGGGSRFRLLETVRLYGLQRLAEADESRPTRDRHRDHYLAVLEAVDFVAAGDDLAQAEVLTPDIENLRAAHTWSDRTGRADLVARQTAATAGLYWQWGHEDEAIEWANRSLAAPDLPDEVASLVWFALGVGSMLKGELLTLDEQFGNAVRLAGDDRTRTYLLVWQALANSHQPEVADGLLDQAQTLTRPGSREYPFVLMMRGAIPLFNGDAESCVAVYEAADDRPGHGTSTTFWWHTWYTTALALMGRPSDALTRIDDDEVLATPWGGYALHVARALAHQDLGDRHAALASLDAATDELRRRGVPLADRDIAAVTARILIADGATGDALELLGAARGQTPTLALRSPSSWAIFTDTRAKAFASIGGVDSARAHYRRGREQSLDDLQDAARARLSGAGHV